DLTLGQAGGTLTFTGGVSATSPSLVTINGSILTDGGDADFTGGTIEVAGTSIIDTEQGDNGAAGAVVLGGSVSSSGGAAVDLTINTATAALGLSGGDITLGTFDSGGGDPIRNLYLVTTGDAGDGVVTSASAVVLTGLLSVDLDSSSATLTAGGTDLSTLQVLSGYDITVDEAGGIEVLTSTITNDLSITSTGPVTVSGTISSGGGSVSITTSGMLTINNDITAGTGAQVDLNGTGITIASTADTTITGSGGIQTDSGTGTLTLGSASFTGTLTNSGSAASIDLTGDDLNIHTANGTISTGIGNLVIIPSTVSQTTSLGTGSTGLGLSAAELNRITTSGELFIGDGTITGSISSDGAINLSSGGLSGPVTLQNANGGITLNHAVTVPADLTISTVGTLSLGASGDVIASGPVQFTATAGISTAGDVTTDALGATVDYVSAVTLTGDVTVDTTGGAAPGSGITFGGTIDGAFALDLTAGTGTVDVAG
ncbi:beta strand repeat-containing protein, partial [Spirochaeta lutea]|uniref:beta strand repeat-containing protein n=1 Tax=Spirochaeta lutea TaxID=1480694 RepID=UPI0005614040